MCAEGKKGERTSQHPPPHPLVFGPEVNTKQGGGQRSGIACAPHAEKMKVSLVSLLFFFSFLPERQHSQPATSLPVSYNYRQTDADYRRRGERERARDAAAASNNGWENDRLDIEVT